MSAIWYAVIAVALLFLIIMLLNSRFYRKQGAKDKAPKEKKEKPKKEKKEKVKKEKVPKEKKEKTSSKFVRPRDLIKQKEAQKAAEEAKRKAEEDAKPKAPELGEGESDNPNFTEPPLDVKQEAVESKQETLADEIKRLSPEMKALIFGDALDKK